VSTIGDESAGKSLLLCRLMQLKHFQYKEHTIVPNKRNKKNVQKQEKNF
jgi:ABC-type phosphate/phosphonate transport system ATPase subunit